MTETTRVPWAEMLQTALRMGVRPADFWALSLREWQAICGRAKKCSFRKSDLSALISAFPDMETSK